MSAACASPIGWDRLVDYWAGDLPAADEDLVEEHLFACPTCSAMSAAVASVTEALRAELAPLLAPEALARLRASSMRIAENRMLPGERKEVPFPADIDLLVHCLGGLDLSRATRVGFRLRLEQSDAVVLDVDDAPFDRDGGAVLLACQHHFDVFPPDTIAEVRAVDDAGRETVASYAILHRFA